MQTLMMKLRQLGLILSPIIFLSVINIVKVHEKSVPKKSDWRNLNVSLLDQPANKDFNQQDRVILSIPFLDRERTSNPVKSFISHEN